MCGPHFCVSLSPLSTTASLFFKKHSNDNTVSIASNLSYLRGGLPTGSKTAWSKGYWRFTIHTFFIFWMEKKVCFLNIQNLQSVLIQVLPFSLTEMPQNRDLSINAVRYLHTVRQFTYSNIHSLEVLLSVLPLK